MCSKEKGLYIYHDISKSDKFEIINNILNSKNIKIPINKLCSIAKVSRSGYYNWKKSISTRKAKEKKDLEDFKYILNAYKMYGYKKGIEQIYSQLIHESPQIIINIKKIKRLMNKFNLSCNIRKPSTISFYQKEINNGLEYPYLIERNFKNKGPRMILLTDVTYFIKNGTYYYLSVIKDAYTNEILAHAFSTTLNDTLILKTLKILKEKHGKELTNQTIINSDQGVCYKSYKYKNNVESLGLKQSMSRRGKCLDNAPVESFFGHMKDEIDLSNANTFSEIKTIIDNYIHIYNNKRYCKELCMLSPSQFYQFITNNTYPSYLENIYPEKNLKLPKWILKYKKERKE